MAKTITTLSLDSEAVEECKRRGFALSTLLSKLLVDYLKLSSSPEEKLKEALALKEESDKLKSEAERVLTAEEEADKKLREQAEADELRAEKEREEHEKKLNENLELLREQLKDTTDEDVEKMFKEAWNHREENTRAYRCAFSSYMAERKLR